MDLTTSFDGQICQSNPAGQEIGPLHDHGSLMDGGEYKSDFELTTERVMSVLLVILWVVIGYREFGIVIAVRAAVFFTMALGCVWFPDLVAKLKSQGRQRDAGFVGPVSGSMLKVFGWMMILGIPAVWFLYSKVL